MEYIVKKGTKMIDDQHTFTKTISEKWEPALPQKFKSILWQDVWLKSRVKKDLG
jgi:hypothetical protein